MCDVIFCSIETIGHGRLLFTLKTVKRNYLKLSAYRIKHQTSRPNLNTRR